MRTTNYVRAITMYDRIHQAIVEAVNSELRNRGMKTVAMAFNSKPSPASLLLEFHGPTDEAGEAGRIFAEVKGAAAEAVTRFDVEWLVVGQATAQKSL